VLLQPSLGAEAKKLSPEAEEHSVDEDDIKLPRQADTTQVSRS
jgi:hypothetical protein